MTALTFTRVSGVGNDTLLSGQGKLIDIGNGGLSGSTTVINLGSALGGNTILNVFGQIISSGNPLYFTTAGRPVPTSIGQTGFDTTLGLPVWVSQVSPAIWVDAAGVQV
jgi:S1-C subfamily serine protease